jgi:hypothetical protein
LPVIVYRHERAFPFKSGSTPHINSFELGQHASGLTMLQHLRPAFVLIVLFGALTGLVYPQITMPYQADGSLIEKDGAGVGSALLAVVQERPLFPPASLRDH